MIRMVLALSLCLSLAALSTGVHAYGVRTHRLLAERAADVSGIDQMLRHALGFPDGARSALLARTPRQWVGVGAVNEDRPANRVLAHFHDPLAPLAEAGLLGASVSSVVWGQRVVQDLTGTWSWPAARESHWLALRGETALEREGHLADTFRALGQVGHLIQDASVPAHVRADPHLPVIDPDPYEAATDRTAARDPATFSALLSPAVRPPATIFGGSRPVADEAPVPIARLTDGDLYGGTNPAVLLRPDAGIAEYTNGNFLSKDTIFTRFPFPSRDGFGPGLKELLEPIPWRGETRYRRYFTKGAEGETITRFVADSMLHRTASAVPPFRGVFTLADGVLRDYAAKLLPRAVGYSAALIDYFFRGKLDARVELAGRPGDPALLRLVGRNVSDEALGPGRLTLLAERRGAGARRVPVLLVVPPPDPRRPGVVDVAVVQPGAALPRIEFRAPDSDVARYVIVYDGDLGQELSGQPPDFMGAVVGQVIRGVEAQAIAPAGGRLLLRTAEAVVPLPGVTDGIAHVQWGDLDNTFVGMTLDLAATPNAVKAFRIDRPVGTTEVPLVPGTDGAPVVAAEALRDVPFPFGLALGTTIHFSQRTRVVQSLLTYDRVVTGTPPADGEGCLASTEISPLRHETVVDEPIDFSERFPIVLDHAHLTSAQAPAPYAWRVVEVGFDADLRPLALVQVVLTTPTSPGRTVALRARDESGQLVAVEERPASARFPLRSLLWAVIDVERGRVLGTTAGETISLATTEADGAALFLVQEHVTFVGCATGSEAWRLASLIGPPEPGAAVVETGTVTFPASERSQTLDGWYRADLDPLVGTSLYYWPRTRAATRYYAVGDAGGQPVYHAARWQSTEIVESGYLTVLEQGMRVRPATAGDTAYLLLFTRPVGDRDEGEEAILVRWSPEDPARTRLAHPRPLPPATYTLAGATPAAVLLTAVDAADRPLSTLIDLESGEATAFPGRDLGEEYRLLAPGYLYNVVDTHFHATDTLLTESTLPPTLAPAPPEPAAAYQVIQPR